MTREEAVEKVKSLPGWSAMPRDAAALHVESLITLGLLTVTAPLTVEQEAEDWLHKHGWSHKILEDIRKGGFKITR